MKIKSYGPFIVFFLGYRPAVDRPLLMFFSSNFFFDYEVGSLQCISYLSYEEKSTCWKGGWGALPNRDRV